MTTHNTFGLLVDKKDRTTSVTTHNTFGLLATDPQNILGNISDYIKQIQNILYLIVQI